MRLFLALLFGIPAFGQPAYLHGTILDLHDAVLVVAPVQVISESARCETKSDNRGEFHCQLPPGTYTVTSTIPIFFPYRRTVTLPAGHSYIKIRPVITESVIALTVDETGSHDVMTPPGPAPKIEEHRVNGTDVLIRYNKMTKSDGTILFHGHYRFGDSYLC